MEWDDDTLKALNRAVDEIAVIQVRMLHGVLQEASGVTIDPASFMFGIITARCGMFGIDPQAFLAKMEELDEGWSARLAARLRTEVA